MSKKRFTAAEAADLITGDLDIFNNDGSYPSDELSTEYSGDDHDTGTIPDEAASRTPPQPQAPAKRMRTLPRQRIAAASEHKLKTGWSKTYIERDSSFKVDNVGPKNIPEHLNEHSTPNDFLDLFLDEEFWDGLVHFTNLRAMQTHEDSPEAYYANLYTPVDVEEMKAFLGLRLQMENSVIKPRYEQYFSGQGNNFLSHTPGFRQVMDRDRFLSLWTFLHIVDEQSPQLNKTDKIYKMRPMFSNILEKFQHYFTPKQFLSLDEGMIPTKNRLAIKQYIKDKPVKWGIKSFLLCESETGYIINAEIYTGRHEEQVDELGATGSVVDRMAAGVDISDKGYVLVMDRFYNSPSLSEHLLLNRGIFSVGTAMPNRKFYPKSLQMKGSHMERGDNQYLCHQNMTALVWMDKKPVNFISTLHDPNDIGTIERRNKDGTKSKIKYPKLVSDYNKYMGGTDKNDQMTRLHRSRKHYRWPRRLFVKFVMWCCYNAYVVMNSFSPHAKPGRRTRTFQMFIDDISIGLVGVFRSVANRRPRDEVPDRMLNVGTHFPIRPSAATTDNQCVVCTHQFNKYRRDHPGEINPFKRSKTTFMCTTCLRYLCIKEGSTCWADYHLKKEYWR